MLEDYLNKGIKEIITEFPKVADMLNEYNIGCVPCNVGSCLLKDIVEIHNLSVEQEQELLSKIAKEIFPNEEVKIPKIQRKPPVKEGEIKYSPPMKKLVEEHTLIKKWISLIPDVIEDLDLKSQAGRKVILDGVDFIRSYADKYHHAKEEEILFKYFDENLDIIKTMLKDHESARNHAKAIIEAVGKQDKETIVEHLNGYKELLTEHIKKEDEILYPWIDRNLSIAQVGELFSKFNEADKRTGEVVPDKSGNFIRDLEERIQKGGQMKPRLMERQRT